jgi:aryl-alcohol dehydrogenase-like predicted oxidoreductase
MSERKDRVRARVTLGHSDIGMCPLGLGCMTMSRSYVDADREDSIATVREAIELGAGMFDTADVYVARACEASLRRLRTDHIDPYYCHRQDPSVPIEETVGAMGELVTQGKMRAIGHCELSVDHLRREPAAFPLSALQSEYSLWERSVEGSGVSGGLPGARHHDGALQPAGPRDADRADRA